MLINVYGTHHRPPALAVAHQVMLERDRSDPALEEHLQGLGGWVLVKTEAGSVVQADLLSHISRVWFHWAFEMDEGDWPLLEAWCLEANAVIYLADSTLRDPSGLVLVDHETGVTEASATVPFFDHGARRKQRSIEVLSDSAAGTGLPGTAMAGAASLPSPRPDPEVDLRSVVDVVRRMAALTMCALQGEAIASGGVPIPLADIEGQTPMALAAMTADELAFVSNPAPTPQQVVDNTWRYEAVATLQWALGLANSLPHPQQPCDAGAVARTTLTVDLDVLGWSAQLRPIAEILDQADLHYRLHWAVRDAELAGGEAPAGLLPGVIVERRHVFEWLSDPQTEWDDISPDT